jgi:hypothetical protein
MDFDEMLLEDDPLSLSDLLEQGLLKQEQVEELKAWFRASCKATAPLDLPESLYQALVHAKALATLAEPGVTRH